MSDESSVRIAVTASAPGDAACARFLHCAKVHLLAAQVARGLSTIKRAERWSVSTGTAPVVVITLGPKGNVQLARDVAAAACVLEQIEVDRPRTGNPAAEGAAAARREGINPMHLLAAPGTFDDIYDVRFERIVGEGERQILTLGVVMSGTSRARLVVRIAVGGNAESYRTIDDEPAGLHPAEGRWQPLDRMLATDEMLERMERAFGGGMYPVTLLPHRATSGAEPEECEDNACAGCEWCDRQQHA